MKIGIDLSPAENDPAGIGQYSASLFSELCQLDKKNQYFSYTSAPLLFANTQNKVIKVNKSLPASGLRWMRAVAHDAKKEKLDLLISPSNHMLSKFFPRTIQFVHDLAPLHYPEFFGKKASIKYGQTLKISANNALKTITISKTIQNELIEKFPKLKGNIDYIYPGLNKWVELNNKNEAEVLEKYNIDYDYMLTLGTLEPRKNHINTIKAFSIFKRKTLSPLKLVIIGKKGWYFEDIFKTVDELGLGNEVIFTGYIPNQDLSSMLNNAKVFMFMSFYEGFGIPPLEALSLNVKTLVSDIPIFREAYQDKAVYTDPHSPDKIADSIASLLETKPKKTAEFVKKNYSWEKSAKKLLSIIDDLR